MRGIFLGQVGEQIVADVGGIDLGAFPAPWPRADARPMPCAADVTIAVLPLSLSAMDFITPGQPIFRRLPSASHRDLSMTNDDLCYLTARDALELFPAGKSRRSN